VWKELKVCHKAAFSWSHFPHFVELFYRHGLRDARQEDGQKKNDRQKFIQNAHEVLSPVFGNKRRAQGDAVAAAQEIDDSLRLDAASGWHSGPATPSL